MNGRWKYLKMASILLLACVLVCAMVKSWLLEPVKAVHPIDTTISLNEVGQVTRLSEQGITTFECTYEIPDYFGGNLALAVESFTNAVSVLLDGEEISSYSDQHRERGFNIQWIVLPEDAVGRELRVLSELSTDDSTEPEIYLGTQNAMYLRYLRTNATAIVFGGFFVMLGLVLVLSALFMRSRDKSISQKTYLHLGGFVLMTGVWTITDSQSLQFLTGRTAGIALTSFVSFMLLPCFFLMFFQDMLDRRHRAIDVLCCLMLVNAGVVLLCYIARIAQLYTTLMGTHALLFAAVVAIVRISVSEYRRRRQPELKKILIGIALLLGFAMCALASFYLENANGHYSLYYNVGMLLFVLCLIRAFLDYTYRQIKETADLDAYKNIAFTDLMTGLGNRSAFMTDVESLPPDGHCICLMMDMNNLKTVNDTFGHAAGDAIIVEAAHCIRDSFAPAGKCYRIGGDEFAVLLEGVSREAFLQRMEGLKRRVEERNAAKTPELQLAYGYADSAELHRPSVMELFEMADQRMYQRKKLMKEAGAGEGA